jgi:CRP-like cAMP-binding protein
MPDSGALKTLSPADRNELYAQARKRRYGRREIVFHEGDIGDSAIIVLSGCFGARKAGPSGEPGTVWVVGPGELAGELALLEPATRRTVTLVALDPSEALILERDTFAVLAVQRPGIERFLLAALAARIRRLDEQLARSLLGTSEDRIAVGLVSLADLCPPEDDAGCGIALTQQDLASLTGTSRATVNRILGQLAEQGVLEVRRGRIRVLDRDRMLMLLK